MRQLAIIVGSAVLTLLLLQTTVLAVSKVVNGNDSHDPLAPYTELLPGQVIGVSMPPACSTYQDHFDGYSYSNEWSRICYLSPDEGAFQTIRIHLHERTIQYIHFQADHLSVGDLAQYWGIPVVRYEGANDHYAYASWETDRYQMTVRIKDEQRWSYWMPVEWLSIELRRPSGSL